MHTSFHTKNLARHGLLIALALLLGYVESLVPAFFGVPGMKLGLTNVCVLFALYRLGLKDAVIINFVRILLCGLLFGSLISLAYSFAGGLLSLLGMALCKKFGRFRLVSVSILGGVLHNVGQILVAMFLLNTTAIAWYLLVLWFGGILAGALVGVIGAQVCKRVPV